MLLYDILNCVHWQSARCTTSLMTRSTFLFFFFSLFSPHTFCCCCCYLFVSANFFCPVGCCFWRMFCVHFCVFMIIEWHVCVCVRREGRWFFGLYESLDPKKKPLFIQLLTPSIHWRTTGYRFMLWWFSAYFPLLASLSTTFYLRIRSTLLFFSYLNYLFCFHRLPTIFFVVVVDQNQFHLICKYSSNFSIAIRFFCSLFLF